jgi:serine/threonine protein kinase
MSSSSNVVGVHYRVGKKIGEGSFGVIFEGTNLLNNQQVAIKFVSDPNAVPRSGPWRPPTNAPSLHRNRGKATLHNCEMNTGHTRSL